ncbi:MAG TPA: T9SS type A sorting domain-containing protein [Bacteroidia bacterium]|nr:T9SS type A sorting domain-containing protein [Bacteroidia bacterium]
MKFRLLILSCLCLLLHSYSQAQWVQTNGPYGGTATCLASSGNTLYIGTSANCVWSTNDNGNSWTRNCPPTSTTVNYVETLCVQDSFLIAGGGGTISRSSDNGNTWNFMNAPGYGNQSCTAVLSNNIFMGTCCGVIRSTDDGLNWVAVNNGLGNAQVLCLLAYGSTLYAGTLYNGIFKSTDLGNTWTSDSLGLDGAYVYGIAIDDLNQLYAATSTGMYKKFGVWWLIESNGLTDLNCIALACSGSHLITASNSGHLSYSTDYGNSWSPSTLNDDLYVYQLTFHNNYAFAATYNGVFRSADFGMTWTETSGGLLNTRVNHLVKDDSVLIAGFGLYYGGLHTSSDSGATWNHVNNAFAYSPVSSLLVSDTLVFAGVSAVSNGTPGGIYRSGDHGTTWVSSDAGIPTYHKAIASVVDNGNYLFAAGVHGNVYRSPDNGATWNLVLNTLPPGVNISSAVVSDTTVLLHTSAGLMMSTDNGTTWVPSGTGTFTGQIYGLFVSGNTIYVQTTLGGLNEYISTDNGLTWTTNTTFPNAAMKAIASSGSTIFRGTLLGLYRSVDNGASWSLQNAGLPDIATSLLIDDSTLYAGLDGSGVYKNSNLFCSNSTQTISPASCDSYTSPSGHYTWTTSGTYTDTIPNATGCDSIITINLTILPSPVVAITASGPTTFCQGDSVVLSATPGIFGYQWHRRNLPIAGATDSTFTVKYKGPYKCVAQNSVGCSDTSNKITVSVPCIPIGPNQLKESVSAESENIALQIYPNPGTGLFTITSTLNGTLHVYNMLGKLILSQEFNKGNSTVDITGYPAGIYLASMQTAEGVVIRRVEVRR